MMSQDSFQYNPINLDREFCIELSGMFPESALLRILFALSNDGSSYHIVSGSNIAHVPKTIADQCFEYYQTFHDDCLSDDEPVEREFKVSENVIMIPPDICSGAFNVFIDFVRSGIFARMGFPVPLKEGVRFCDQHVSTPQMRKFVASVVGADIQQTETILVDLSKLANMFNMNILSYCCDVRLKCMSW